MIVIFSIKYEIVRCKRESDKPYCKAYFSIKKRKDQIIIYEDIETQADILNELFERKSGYVKKQDILDACTLNQQKYELINLLK